MRILLTNDDGIYAPGLRALREELMTLGDVTVVAPAAEQSAAGHSVTLLVPLLIQEVFDDQKRFLGWAVEGRPADCVKLALLELLPEPPDLIVSGLNAGSNAGINVLYSGTVAAAIEGSFFRLTSIACSLGWSKGKPLDFRTGAAHSRKVIEQILKTKPTAGTLFNVNIPSLENGPVKGIRVLPQNVAPYVENFIRRVDPRGRTYFWLGNDFGCPEPHPDTDEIALRESYITVTPLQFDLTNHAALAGLQKHEWTL
ncbi:MAG: 5'/3'-nucleotidase SurE [Planctomycetes bacterium]|nr:5'/3'-nucleotidase SurE [Planctomycetota bacterium]